VIAGDGLHGGEIGVEGSPSELLQRHQEVQVVRRAITLYTGVGADIGFAT
jgi:hypothetical protein